MEQSVFHMLLSGPKHGVNVLGLPLGVTQATLSCLKITISLVA
jgi:hypothetical protein